MEKLRWVEDLFLQQMRNWNNRLWDLRHIINDTTINTVSKAMGFEAAAAVKPKKMRDGYFKSQVDYVINSLRDALL